MTQSPLDNLPSKSSVAAAIMKRRADQRQRFDSADYAMALQHKQQQLHQRPPARSTPSSELPRVPAPLRANSEEFSDWVQCELEPEPSSPQGPSSTTVPQQQIQRIRLQRFDSADWAMQCHNATNEHAASNPSTSQTVAKIILDRHGYRMCNLAPTVIDPPPQRYVKNA